MNLFDDFIIHRDSRRYEDIENFKDYELTNCIAFELAIRNKDVQRGIIEVLKIIDVLDCEPEDIVFEDETIKNDILDKLEDKQNYLEFIHTKYLTYKYKIDLKNTINYLLENLQALELFFFCNNDDEKYEEIPKYEIKPDFLNSIDLNCYYESKISNSSSVHSYDNKNILSIFQNSRSEHFITQKLSRPKLTEPNDLKRSVHILDIDLNSPLDEIKSYIEEIYNSYHSTKGEESPYILNSFSYVNSNYDHKLFPYTMYIIYEKNSFYDHREIPKITLEELFSECEIEFIEELNISKRLSKQDWADLFFIYDYYKSHNIGINEGAKRLQSYFDNYYYVKVRKPSKTIHIKLEDYHKNPHLFSKKNIDYNSYYSISSIKGKYNLIKKLIEDALYTKLITG